MDSDRSDPEGVEIERVPLGSWWMLFVLFVLYLSSHLDRIILSMLVEPIKADILLSDVQMSIILGPAFALFYALFGLPMGWAADRYSRRWVIYFGVTIWSLAAAAGGLARSFLPLLLARVMVGTGEAALTPAAYSLMGDKFPKRRLTTAMSIYQTGAQVGTAAAFAIGGMVIAMTMGLKDVRWPIVGMLEPWQLTLIITGAPGLLLAFLVFTFSEPARHSPRAKVSGRALDNIFTYIWSERALMIPMIVGFSLIVIVATSLQSWAPAYITREFGWGPAKYGPAIGIITLISGATMVLKGWFVDWLYAKGVSDAHLRFFTWVVAIAIPCSLVAFFVPDPVIFLVFYGILQVTVAQFVVYLAATLRMVGPRHLRAQAVALFISMFGVIGYGLGPVVTATITDYVFRDEAKLGYSLAVVTGVALPLAWILLRVALRSVRPALGRADQLV